MHTKELLEQEQWERLLEKDAFINGMKMERDRIMEILMELRYAGHDPKKGQCCDTCDLINSITEKIYE